MNKRTYFTNQRCPKCGNLLRTSDLPQYSFVCPSCDENFYGIELEEKPKLPFDFVPCSFATNFFERQNSKKTILSISIAVIEEFLYDSKLYKDLEKICKQWDAICGYDKYSERLYVEFNEIPSNMQVQEIAIRFDCLPQRKFMKFSDIIFDYYNETEFNIWSEIHNRDLKIFPKLKNYLGIYSIGPCGIYGSNHEEREMIYINLPQQYCTEFEVADTYSTVELSEFLSNYILKALKYDCNIFALTECYTLRIDDAFHYTIYHTDTKEPFFKVTLKEENGFCEMIRYLLELLI